MAQSKRVFFPKQKDWLAAKRNMILYAILVLAFAGLVVGWRVLPDPVRMTQPQEGSEPMTLAKNAAMGAHFLLSAGFGTAFWFRPRELAYLLGSVLGLVLTYGVIYINVGL